MRRGFVCSLLLCFLTVVLSAAGPEATVSSPEPFRLRGVVVPVAGVPSWPLLAGDEIATDRAPATIRFADGSSVVLQQNSAARIERSDDRGSVFRLLSGFMDAKPSAASNVRFYSQVQTANAPILKTALVTTGGWKRPPPNSSPH